MILVAARARSTKLDGIGPAGIVRFLSGQPPAGNKKRPFFAGRQRGLVGTPRCGVRSAQRADPTFPDAPITKASPFLRLVTDFRRKYRILKDKRR
jgi:hypothetical protein